MNVFETLILNFITYLPVIIILYFVLISILTRIKWIAASKLFIGFKKTTGAMVIIVIVVYFVLSIATEQSEFNEFDIYTSLFQALITYIIVHMVLNQISHDYSDHFETDFDPVIERYHLEKPSMIKIHDSNSEEPLYFPNVMVYRKQRDTVLSIEFMNQYVPLDPLLVKNADKIAFEYHQSRNADIMNEPLLKLQDVQNGFIKLAKTKNIDKVITNWSVDFKFKDAFSIRDWFEPGPYLSDLKESEMSNGIGFNIVVKTTDDKFIISRRNKKTLVSNSNYASSLMGRIPLNLFKRRFNMRFEAMEGAFQDKLFTFFAEYLKGYYLPLHTDTDHVKEAIELMAVGRDLLTGGTPQFYLYCDLANIRTLSDRADSSFVKDQYLNNIEQALNSDHPDHDLIDIYRLKNKKFNQKHPLHFKGEDEIKLLKRKTESNHPNLLLAIKEGDGFKKVPFTPSEMVVWAFLKNMKQFKIRVE